MRKQIYLILYQLLPKVIQKYLVMQDKPIYYIENRGWFFIYHFLIFMVGGFRHIKEEKPKIYIPYMKEFLLDQDKNALAALSKRGDTDQAGPRRENGSKFSYSTAGINYEIMNFLKDEFIFMDSLAGVPNLDKVPFIYNHGEPVTLHYTGKNVHDAVYIYLRDLFLRKIPPTPIEGKKSVYITRRNSENITGNFGVRKRQVLNEDELCQMLAKYNFLYINLELLSLQEKINLFLTSKIILSPNSGGLTFSFLGNEKTTIIELIPAFEVGQYKQEWKQEHYKEMCEAVGVGYIRFQDMTYVEDELNMKVNVSSLDTLLSSLLS